MIIKYPLSTEKTIRMMESDNTLIFIVDKNASKIEIKKALEELYGVKIKSVNTTIDPKNRKKAYVKFSSETPAIDLATQLGIM
ncbi:MAG: 50S ribosomal protein L23 [archaeon]